MVIGRFRGLPFGVARLHFGNLEDKPISYQVSAGFNRSTELLYKIDCGMNGFAFAQSKIWSAPLGNKATAFSEKAMFAELTRDVPLMGYYDLIQKEDDVMVVYRELGQADEQIWKDVRDARKRDALKKLFGGLVGESISNQS